MKGIHTQRIAVIFACTLGVAVGVAAPWDRLPWNHTQSVTRIVIPHGCPDGSDVIRIVNGQRYTQNVTNGDMVNCEDR